MSSEASDPSMHHPAPSPPSSYPQVEGGSPSAPGELERPIQARVLSSLRRMIRAIDMHSRQLTADVGVTGPQLICLGAVATASTPLTQGQLARAVHLAPSTVVGILDRLEIQGLVTRRRGERDRRQVFLEVTRSGLELLGKAPSPLQTSLSEALDELGEHERELVASSLERVVALMARRNPSAMPPPSSPG